MNDLKRPFSLDTYLADLAPLINLDCGTRTPAGVAPGREHTLLIF